MAWLRPVTGVSLAAALMALAGSAGGETSRLHNRDVEEQTSLKSVAPRAAELLERAEGLVTRGKLTEAEPLLAEAAQAAPTSFLVARRQCQVLSELGRRASAIEACNRALKGGHMAMDRFASVSALMTGPAAPTTREVAQAVLLAMTAKNLTGQPFGDAALCEIAYRLGDAQMLRDCTTELSRIAPAHYLTRRYAGLVDRTQARFWGVWALLGLGMIGTGLHALRRRRGARRAVTGVAIAATLSGSCLVLTPREALAQEGAPAASAAAPAPSAAVPQPRKQKSDGHWQLSRFPIDHENPERAIPTEAERNKEPLDFGYFLQDLAAEGAYAEKKGDYAAAVKYWRALAKAVPDTATGFRRACRAYEQLKDRVHGLDFCGSTLNLEGAELEDYLHYGNLMLMKTTALDAAELSDFENTIKHLREQSGDGARYVAETLSCELAVAQQDVKRLEQCTQALEKMKPGETQTLAFAWSLAMFRHDYTGARELVSRLKAAQYKPALLASMEAAIQSESRWYKRFVNDWRYQLGLGTLVVGLLGWLFSRRKPGIATQAPPSAAPGVT